MKKNVQRFLSLFIAIALFVTAGTIPSTTAKAAGQNKGEAKKIELGEEISDAISVKTEEDWYYFTTEKTVNEVDSWFKISLMFQNKKENGYEPSIYLYTENGKELEHVTSSRENEEKSEFIKLEQEKTYYILVRSECKNDTADYTFTVSEVTDEAGEDQENANNLECNITNRFKLQSPFDSDWFMVKSDSATPTILLKNANIVSFVAEVYDMDGVRLESISVDAAKSQTQKLDIPDKEFYIKVYSEYSTEESYGNYIIAINDQVLVSKITLNKSKINMSKGKSMTLEAQISPSDAQNQEVTWKSSNTTVATVSKTGRVIAKKKGTAVITCSTTDGSGKKASCKITVR